MIASPVVDRLLHRTIQVYAEPLIELSLKVTYVLARYGADTLRCKRDSISRLARWIYRGQSEDYQENNAYSNPYGSLILSLRYRRQTGDGGHA
jgi:hypothetical protein